MQCHNRTKECAKALRQKQSPPEIIFWRQIRDRRLGGFKFRRQYPIGRYVADFYCADLRLVIEIDGGLHCEEAQRVHDEERTRWIESRGYRVVRFWGRDVLNNLEGVLTVLLDEMEMLHG
jgi:very-short-patch-repair endonuclease